MKDDQNISFELQTKQYQANPNNQIPPSDNLPSDTPLEKSPSDENERKEKPAEHMAFSGNALRRKTQRPVAGDDQPRLL